MKKKLLLTLVILSTTLFGAAKETKILPIFTGGYCAAPTVALMGGYGKYKDADNGAATYGVELGFACPVFQIKDLEINQVLSLVHSDKDGLKATTLEMNPRIMFAINEKTKFGFGPGLGVVFAETSGEKDTVIGVNLGASLNYNITPEVFIGIESRYQWTQKAEFTTGTETNLNNSRTMLKIGRHF